jgi:hypothetical protein
LQNLSSAKVTVVSSYWNQAEAEFEVSPFATTEEILAEVAKKIANPADRFYGAITVRRSWVLEDFPGADALEVIAEALRFCDCLVADFLVNHCQGKSECPPDEALEPWPPPLSADEMDEVRTKRMSTHTGKVELTRFCGHLSIGDFSPRKGSPHGKDEAAIYAGVPL